MEKELTKAEKGRKTKLSKMGNEELIAIILRKDETEHKYSNINKCLKANVLGLENKVKDKDDRIAELEDELVTVSQDCERKANINVELNKRINELHDGLIEAQHTNDELHRNLVLRKRDLRILLYALCAAVGLFIGSLIYYYYCIQ